MRKLLLQCRICQRHEGGAYKAPMAPPLPEFRTTVDFPFSYTGVDFAGPVFVREGDDTRSIHLCC